MDQPINRPEGDISVPFQNSPFKSEAKPPDRPACADGLDDPNREAHRKRVSLSSMPMILDGIAKPRIEHSIARSIRRFPRRAQWCLWLIRSVPLCWPGRRKIDVGLHVNLTTFFSAFTCPAELLHHHQKVAGYLKRHRLAQIVYHPGLSRSFQYVLTAQLINSSVSTTKRPTVWTAITICTCVRTCCCRGSCRLEASLGEIFHFYRARRVSPIMRTGKSQMFILGRRHRMTDFFFSLSRWNLQGKSTADFSLSSQIRCRGRVTPRENGRI